MTTTGRISDPTPTPPISDPDVRALTQILGVAGEPPPDGAAVAVEHALDALDGLRRLRARLDTWEPRLIALAREAGASWAQLAPVLGVASRQAAERRYLRLHQPDDGPAGATRDERVQAVRDRRAGDRAVSAWARDHGADLRQLAGQITALTDLGPQAQPSLDRLHDSLGSDDAAALVPLLAAAGQHLTASHGALADRVAGVTQDTDQVRHESRRRRTSRRG
jgi:hypothetical protein